VARYKNKFYNAKYDNSKLFIETDSKPVEHKGYLIYERIKGVCFDVVKKGVCVGMYAGINGAKQAIDNKRI
jgi:hypothetical protein